MKISRPTSLNYHSGILNGFIPLKKDGSLDLDHVLLKSGCMCCDKELGRGKSVEFTSYRFALYLQIGGGLILDGLIEGMWENILLRVRGRIILLS